MLFLDSAVIEEAVAAARLPWVGGLSLNPTLLSGAIGAHDITRAEFRRHVVALAEALPGTLFVQTVSHDLAGIIADARDLLSTIDAARLVIKIPYSPDGLRATHQLERDDVPTCTTSVHTPLQAYVAASTGARWIAPYCNRITQAGGDGVAAVRAMGETLRAHGLPCQLLVASVKSPQELEDVVRTGARHVTVPLALLEAVGRHPASDAAGERFRADLRWSD